MSKSNGWSFQIMKGSVDYESEEGLYPPEVEMNDIQINEEEGLYPVDVEDN